MNNFFVIANTEKDYAMQTADKVEEFLQARGYRTLERID